jgi:hypothetical protein
MSHDDFMIAVLIAVAVVAVLAIVVALPVVLSMRQAAKDREFQHAERLKALEMGRPMPGETVAQGPASAIGIGFWVPICVFGIAVGASQVSHGAATEVAIWVSAGCVGVTALICGTILAMRAQALDGRAADHLASAAKPSFDEHEVDTVSRRGY